MATTSVLVFRNRDGLSLFVSSNTTLLELQTLLFLFFFQNLRLQIGGAAYLRMRLIHGRLQYFIFFWFLSTCRLLLKFWDRILYGESRFRLSLADMFE